MSGRLNMWASLRPRQRRKFALLCAITINRLEIILCSSTTSPIQCFENINATRIEVAHSFPHFALIASPILRFATFRAKRCRRFWNVYIQYFCRHSQPPRSSLFTFPVGSGVKGADSRHNQFEYAPRALTDQKVSHFSRPGLSRRVDPFGQKIRFWNIINIRKCTV